MSHPMEDLSMAELRNLFERQVNLHRIARFIPLLEEYFGDESNSESIEEQNGSSVDNLTNSDFGDIGSDDEDSSGSDNSDDGHYPEGDENDDDSVADEVNNNLPPRQRIYVHEPTDFASPHCPPFRTIETTMHGVCDCTNFGMIECGATDNFEVFTPHLNFADEYGDALSSINSPLRLPSNKLRRRLYSLLFCACDFGILEKSERRKLPNCAVAKIRQIFPSSDGYYMGFLEN